jgi:hypothetical protein
MEQQGLNQTKLAELSGLSQATISRATDPEYGNMNVNTCVDIADGCDVAFIGLFLSFSRFVELLHQEGDHLEIPKFTEEFSDDGTPLKREQKRAEQKLPSANEVQVKMLKAADSVEIKTSNTSKVVSPKTERARIEFNDLQTAGA